MSLNKTPLFFNPASSENQQDNPVVEIVFFDAGGGHRSAANALIDSISTQYPSWKIRLTNLQELLEANDPIFQVLGVRSESVYNAAIRRGWTKGSRPFLRTLQQGIRMNAGPMRKRLEEHWEKAPPNLVVSVIPNFNAVMYPALKSAYPQARYVTIMTDIADSPPHFWMENQDQYIICGSPKAFLQAHMSGFYRPEKIFETSGMILRPSFYEPPAADAITHAQAGLDPDKPTAIIMFGGNGSKQSITIAKELRAQGVQSIVMCGKDKALLATLTNTPMSYPVGYTNRVADHMRLAQLFVGKPGPGSMSEALQMGLVVIVENNTRTMIQERYNPTWAEEKGVAISVPDFAYIGRAVNFLLQDNRLEKYRQRALSLNNRAVFEIPDMLKQILEAPPDATPHPTPKRRALTFPRLGKGSVMIARHATRT